MPPLRKNTVPVFIMKEAWIRSLLCVFFVGSTLAVNPIPYDPADDDWAGWWKEDNLFENEFGGADATRSGGDDDKKQPHIFFLLLDDWGWNDVGYHNQGVITPHIDSLAREGLTLEQNYVYAFCTPSRSALMTGMEAFHIGRQNFVFRATSLSGLTLDRKIMPQYLQDLGYSTHIVGKWHLGHCNSAFLATKRGFDTQYGIQNSGAYNEAHIDYVDPHPYDFFENDTAIKDFGIRVTWQMDAYKERILNLIQQQADQGPGAKPMFMYLAFTSNHFPVEAPFEYLQLYADVDDSNKRRSYLGMTTHMDDVIGNMTQLLKDTGLYDNSIIILMGDNGAYSEKWTWNPFQGGGSNLPLRGQKSEYYEGGTRVPALINSPLLKKKQRGRISNQMVHVSDWLPTIIRAAGGKVTDYPELADIDGVDQYKYLFKDKGAAPRQSFVYNLQQLLITDPDSNRTFPFAMGAIRYGRWKLLNFDGVFPLQPLPTFELYDLLEDPNETTNVAAGNSDVVDKMLEKFQTAAATMVPETGGEFLPRDDQLKILDRDGNQRLDFCDTEGNYQPPTATNKQCGKAAADRGLVGGWGKTYY